jgi:hypothetical protein
MIDDSLHNARLRPQLQWPSESRVTSIRGEWKWFEAAGRRAPDRHVQIDGQGALAGAAAGAVGTTATRWTRLRDVVPRVGSTRLRFRPVRI